MSIFDQVVEAQVRFAEHLIAKSNVVGVAVGYKNRQGQTTGDLALVAMVEQKKPKEALTEEDFIPGELDGMKTDVLEVGRIMALEPTPRDRFRPTVPPGVSIGHPLVTAGTLGAIVRDAATGEALILSNNHVLAASNDALVGDPILQPGPIDGGTKPDDIVAKLERFIKIYYIDDAPPTSPPPTPAPTPSPTGGGSGCDIADLFAAFGNTLARLNGSEKRVQAVPVAQAAATPPENRVDCAVAKPLNASMFSDEIRSIGKITGTKPVELGMRVRKSGRTTDYTEGVVTLMNAIVNVGYNTKTGPRTARFTGQVFTEVMSKGGDSGSLIVDATEQLAVGLLFAGSDVSTIFTPIDQVLGALHIAF